MLASDQYADAVREDEALARELGISGVPFFVFAEKYGVSGAQPADLFLSALQQVWDETEAVAVAGAVSDASCADESGAV